MYRSSQTRLLTAIFCSIASIISKCLRTFITYFLIALIAGIRPLLGPAVCMFPVGCTQFAIESLQTLPLGHALFVIIKRLLACGPWKRYVS